MNVYRPGYGDAMLRMGQPHGLSWGLEGEVSGPRIFIVTFDRAVNNNPLELHELMEMSKEESVIVLIDLGLPGTFAMVSSNDWAKRSNNSVTTPELIPMGE